MIRNTHSGGKRFGMGGESGVLVDSFHNGFQRRSPGRGLGASPPEAEEFYSNPGG